MNSRLSRWLAVLLALALTVGARAQEQPRQKDISNVLMGSVGYTDILDTYLSPEKFTGTEARFISHTVRATPGKRISKEIVHHVVVSVADTRGDGGTLLTALYNLQYGWHYNFAWPSQRLRLRVGGLLDGTVGGMYDTRNGNNPAQARLSLTLTPSAALSWDFRLGGHPFQLGYEIGVPLIGLAFSPQYGQSYYEIFSQGNYDHNVVCVSPFNAPQLHQLLSLDFHLGRSVFRVGYLGDIRQMEANNLKYHQYTHAIVFGWVRHFTLTSIPSSRSKK